VSTAAGPTDPAAPGQPSGLFTDLYELSMAQACLADGLTAEASFEIFFRDLPACRGYALLGGIETALDWLARLHFTPGDIDYLRGLGQFCDGFLDWLAALRFGGDVEAIPEGTVVFAHEPLLRVRAPLPVAQLIETRLLNALHYETLVASKAARIVDAAAGRTVIDFGARRSQSPEAATAAARAAWIAGMAGTSNMVAGRRWGLPVSGTMAHSYVEAWDHELDAFRAFTRHYPDTVLLVDTYDTLGGIERVIELAAELGEDFRVRAVRIDSGDLDALTRAARERLDANGLDRVGIICSGGLNEYRIGALVEAGAPIDGFGVGTDLMASRDAPTLDFAYKLVRYAGEPRLKGSPEKATLPGDKQVFRRFDDGVPVGDTIAGVDEAIEGEPLLVPVMRGGERVSPAEALAAVRERAAGQRASLPQALRRPSPAGAAYRVDVSPSLRRQAEALLARQR